MPKAVTLMYSNSLYDSNCLEPKWGNDIHLFRISFEYETFDFYFYILHLTRMQWIKVNVSIFDINHLKIQFIEYYSY